MKDILTILVVDDDADILDALEAGINMLFEKDDRTIEVITSQFPNEGVEICKKKNPDLIIVDDRMPNMHGPEFVTQLMNNTETKDIPVIGMGGGMEQEWAEAGIVMHLQKPFSSEKLETAIREVLRMG